MLASSAESVILWDIPVFKENIDPNSNNLSIQLTKQWNSTEQTPIITDIVWNSPKTTLCGVFNNYGPLFHCSIMNNEQILKNTCMVGQKCIAIGSRDKLIATAGQDNLLYVYHMTGSRQTSKLSGHSSNITSIQFNENSSHIASGSDNGEIILTNFVYRDTSTPLLAPRVQAINRLCYSPHKTSILGAVSSDGAINIWDASRAKLLHSANQIHSASATGLSFFQDSQILASVGLDGQLALFDSSVFNAISVTSVKSALTCVDVCGDMICVGSKQGSLYLFDRRSMKSALIYKEAAHKSAINCIKFRKNQERFSTGSFNLSTNMTRSPELLAKHTQQSDPVLPVPSVSSAVNHPHGTEDGKTSSRKGFTLKDDDTDISFGGVTAHMSPLLSVGADQQPGDVLGHCLFSPASANASFARSDVSSNQSMASLLWPSFTEQSFQLPQASHDGHLLQQIDEDTSSNTPITCPATNFTQTYHSPFDHISTAHRTAAAAANPELQRHTASTNTSNSPGSLLANVPSLAGRQAVTHSVTPVSLADPLSSMNKRRWDVKDLDSPVPPSFSIPKTTTSSFVPLPATINAMESTPVTSTPLMQKMSAAFTAPSVHFAPETLKAATATTTTTTTTTTAGAVATEFVVPSSTTAAAPYIPSSSSISFKLVHSVVQDAMEEFTDNIHNDFLCMQMNFLRMMQQQKVELFNGFQQQLSFVKDLMAENQQLKLENKQLKKYY